MNIYLASAKSLASYQNGLPGIILSNEHYLEAGISKTLVLPFLCLSQYPQPISMLCSFKYWILCFLR